MGRRSSTEPREESFAVPEFRYSESGVNRIGIAGLVGSFLLVLVAFAFVIFGFGANQRASELVIHTYEIKDAMSAIGHDLERAEAARRGYLLNPSPYQLMVFQDTSARILPGIDRVASLTVDNEAQRARVLRLRPLVERQLEGMRSSIELVRLGQADQARRRFDVANDVGRIEAIRRLSDSIEDGEDALLTQRLAAERASLGQVQWLLVGTAIALLISSLGTMWILRRNTRDLFASRARLHVLNTNLEGAVAERTADLRRANDEIQKFAYIVSHDLRSPLVNVMGFTSELEAADRTLAGFIEKLDREQPGLVDEEARIAALEDLPESIGFIRASSRKMDRLINAILNLSRQGRRVLAPEHLAMNAVVGEIIASLATLADERGATIEIDGALPDLNHDRLAIEQIFQNLLENATKYTRDDRPGAVRVRGRREGSRAIFEVEDNGRGVAPEDHERIFELFRRSGAQDLKGEGIGLAHVRALAYRLGGNVTIRSKINQGSTFIVDLPIAYSAEGDDR